MTELFQRAFRLTIGTIDIDGRSGLLFPLDLSFDVSKSTKREPNTCAIKVYNLSPAQRHEIESTRSLQINLSAGYKNFVELIFSGDLRLAKNTTRRAGKGKGKGKLGFVRDPLEVITEIEAGDGGTAYRDARVSRSYPSGTEVTTVLRGIIDVMGIGAGNLTEFGSLPISGIGTAYQTGTVVYGKARDELNRIIRSAGLSWSIQNGNLQILRGNTPVQNTAVLLTGDTGLIGSPEREIDGTITANTLLIPELMPGRKVVIESKAVDAQCIIKRVTFIGETFGNEWNAKLELKEY